MIKQKEDTTITAIHDNGTKEDFVLCSVAKQEILKKYPAEAIQSLMKFENAMKKYAAKEKDTCIKYMSNCGKYEVEISGSGGNRRIEAAPNSHRFDTFIDDH